MPKLEYLSPPLGNFLRLNFAKLVQSHHCLNMLVVPHIRWMRLLAKAVAIHMYLQQMMSYNNCWIQELVERRRQLHLMMFDRRNCCSMLRGKRTMMSIAAAVVVVVVDHHYRLAVDSTMLMGTVVVAAAAAVDKKLIVPTKAVVVVEHTGNR